MNRRFVYDREAGKVVELAAPAPTKGVARWPLPSESAGIHPTQIEEAREYNRQAGVRNTEYTADGRPVFTGPGHRREYLRAWQMHDRAGYD